MRTNDTRYFPSWLENSAARRSAAGCTSKRLQQTTPAVQTPPSRSMERRCRCGAPDQSPGEKKSPSRSHRFRDRGPPGGSRFETAISSSAGVKGTHKRMHCTIFRVRSFIRADRTAQMHSPNTPEGLAARFPKRRCNKLQGAHGGLCLPIW